MHYYDHALLSAAKFDCNIQDTLRLHHIMDSSKHHFPESQHRLFSHNSWFIQVVVELFGDTLPNTKTGGLLFTRDILVEHCREDHNGHVPSLKDWLESLRFEVPDVHQKWFNTPRRSDIYLLSSIKEKQIQEKLLS